MSSRAAGSQLTPDEKARMDHYEQTFVNPDEKQVFRQLALQRRFLITEAHNNALLEAKQKEQSNNDDFVRDRAARNLRDYWKRLLEHEIRRMPGEHTTRNMREKLSSLQGKGRLSTNPSRLEIVERNLQKFNASSLDPFLVAMDVYYPPPPDSTQAISPTQHSAEDHTIKQEVQPQTSHTPEYDKGYTDALSYIKYFILNDVNGLQSSLSIVWDPTKGWFKDTVVTSPKSPSRQKKYYY